MASTKVIPMVLLALLSCGRANPFTVSIDRRMDVLRWSIENDGDADACFVAYIPVVSSTEPGRPRSSEDQFWIRSEAGTAILEKTPFEVSPDLADLYASEGRDPARDYPVGYAFLPAHSRYARSSDLVALSWQDTPLRDDPADVRRGQLRLDIAVVFPCTIRDTNTTVHGGALWPPPPIRGPGLTHLTVSSPTLPPDPSTQ